MPLIKQTSTGDNFIEKIHTDGDGSALTSMQFYDKQDGSDGASSNTVFTLPDNYTPGSHTLMVFVNGQKVEQVASASNTSEYEETDYTTITFGASLQDADVVEFIVVGSYLTDSDGSGDTGDNLDFSLLNNGYLTIANSVDKPAGIEPVSGITDYTGIAFGDSGKDWIRLNHVSDTQVAYGFAAIPIDDKETYEIIIRHRCNATGTTGLYLRLNELNSALPIGKTHIGWVNTSKVAIKTSSVDVYGNLAFPGAVWQENIYTYTPTAGTKYATFSMYNWDAVAKQYDVDSVQMRAIGGYTKGATVGANWNTNLTNIPPIEYSAYGDDPSNICADPTFEKTASSTNNTFWLMNESSWGATYGYNSNKPGVRLWVNGDGSAAELRLHNDNSAFYLPCVQGDKLYFKARVKRDSNYNATSFRFCFWQYDSSKTYITTKTLTITLPAVDTWGIVEGSLEITDSATVYSTIGFYNSGGTKGFIYFDSVWMGRANPEGATVGATVGATIGTDLKDFAGAIPIQSNILNTDANDGLFDKEPHLYGNGDINKIDFRVSNSQTNIGWYELCRYKCYISHDSITIGGTIQTGNRYFYRCDVQAGIKISDPYTTLTNHSLKMTAGDDQSTFQDMFRMYYYQDTDSRWVIKIYIKLAGWQQVAGQLAVASTSSDPSSSSFSWWDTNQYQADSLGAAYAPAGTQETPTFGYAESANNYVHPNHSGDVSSTGDGATIIGNDKVTNTKLANMAANTMKGRSGSNGDPQDLSAATARTVMGLGNMAVEDFTISTGNPSGGNHGNVWYKV